MSEKQTEATRQTPCLKQRKGQSRSQDEMEHRRHSQKYTMCFATTLYQGQQQRVMLSTHGHTSLTLNLDTHPAVQRQHCHPHSKHQCITPSKVNAMNYSSSAGLKAQPCFCARGMDSFHDLITWLVRACTPAPTWSNAADGPAQEMVMVMHRYMRHTQVHRLRPTITFSKKRSMSSMVSSCLTA